MVTTVLEIREIREKSENFNTLSELQVPQFLMFSLKISFSTKKPNQEVRIISLKSGKGQGKTVWKKWSPCCHCIE